MNEPNIPFEAAGVSTRYGVKRELAENVLQSFGTVRLQVTGYSMLPSLWPGDLVVIERRPIDEISPGDIVLFARHGRLISHRVLARTGEDETERLITRGDAVAAEDFAVSAGELRGKVCWIERGGERIEPGKRLGLAMRVLAAAIARCQRMAGLLVRLRAIQEHGRRQPEVWRAP